jgi:Flp pilus assembly protein TadG
MVTAIGAAVEYGNLAKRRSELQVAADAAALAGANEMSLVNATDQRITSIAKSIVAAKSGPSEAARQTTDVAISPDHETVNVSITETVPSVMGKVMTLPSSQLQVQATARLSNRMRLCMVGLDQHSPGTIHLDQNARVTATGCAIYSNSTNPKGLQGDKNASAVSSLICSAGGFDGKKSQFSPAPLTDCPVNPDPLIDQPAPPVNGCSFNDVEVKNTATTLFPGTYCGGLHITDNAQATLLSGIYVIKDGPLIVENGAMLKGDKVGFYFTGNAAGLRFDPDTSISLTAPKDGVMAGLLMFDDRSLGTPILPPIGKKARKGPKFGPPMREYRIISDDARNLLGTIYLPNGELIVDSSKPVADKSAYTVIVAKQIDLYDGPNLYLNSDYASTDIPVPKGVGSNTSRVSLEQ